MLIPGDGVGQEVIPAAALLLETLGQAAAAARLRQAVEATLRSGVRTPDLGGTATTTEVTRAVVERLADGSWQLAVGSWQMADSSWQLANRRISGSAGQRIGESAGQRIGGSADQQVNESANQRVSESADQRISGSVDKRSSGAAIQRGRGRCG